MCSCKLPWNSVSMLMLPRRQNIFRFLLSPLQIFHNIIERFTMNHINLSKPALSPMFIRSNKSLQYISISVNSQKLMKKMKKRTQTKNTGRQLLSTSWWICPLFSHKISPQKEFIWHILRLLSLLSFKQTSLRSKCYFWLVPQAW